MKKYYYFCSIQENWGNEEKTVCHIELHADLRRSIGRGNKDHQCDFF